MLKWLQRLLWDETAFERYGRMLLVGFATAVVTGAITWPEWMPAWMVSMIMAFGVFIGAGQKNLATTAPTDIEHLRAHLNEIRTLLDLPPVSAGTPTKDEPAPTSGVARITG